MSEVIQISLNQAIRSTQFNASASTVAYRRTDAAEMQAEI